MIEIRSIFSTVYGYGLNYMKLKIDTILKN